MAHPNETLPRVLYDNRFRDEGAAVLYDGAETEGFNIEYASDWRDYTYFRTDEGITNLDAEMASEATMDSAAVFVRTVDLTAGSFDLVLQYESAPSTFTTVHTFSLDNENFVQYAQFSEVTIPAGSRVRWRFDIPAGEYVDVRQLAVGMKLVFETGQHQGIRPTDWDANYRYSNNMSVNGSFIGRSRVREANNASLQLTLLTEAWIEANLLSFMEHMQRFSFFYVWDYDDHPEQSAYAVANQGVSTPQLDTPPGKLSYSQRMSLLTE